jgi:hypothetical protein
VKIPFSEVFGAFLGVLLGLIKRILLNSYTMKQYFSRLLLLFAFCILAVSCSDEEEGTEFLFDREIMELSVIQGCADENDTSACFSVRYRLPIDREDFAYIHVWIDTTVVDDTSKAVSSKQIDKATKSIDYSSGTERVYDTLDLTELVKDYVDQGYDSVQVALFCEYTDGDPGSVQRVFLHFGDDIPPSRVTVYDSVWTTGALFEWYRPTDQTNFYKPMFLSGMIVGYNVVIWSSDKDEDLRDLKITLTGPDGVDSTGSTYFTRHSRIRASSDSVWFDSVSHGDNVKNYLRISITDGKGFDFDADSLNRFRMVIEGLKSMSEYTIGISAWDSVGNSSGTEGLSTVETNQLFLTTDSVAPVMPTRLYFMEDSLFPGMARLDSNNRLRIFWSRGVDPYKVGHPIESDTVVLIPDTCLFTLCYDTVAVYVVEHYDVNLKEWKEYGYAGGSGRFNKLYAVDGDTMTVSATGTFVTDTIRWVSPGDTIIFRIRAKDKSGYYSTALIDTIAVSPGKLASEMECPEGFVPVSTGDSASFCMEKFEHRNDSGEFVYNVLHSEAVAACEGVSASGFTVSLCKERDWELVCLSGGSLSYGVLNELDIDASEYLFSYCNVGTNDSASAADVSKRDYRCVNPMGVRDMPGQYQEWVIGRSEDTVAVAKGSSYKIYSGLDRESLALCTNRSFPYFTRPAYTTDSVYLYREGSKVDTVFAADTSRTLFKVLSQKDFTDSLQFFTVQDSSGNTIGEDYALYSEYKKGGDAWLDTLGNGLKYVPSEVKVVFLTGEKVRYREAAAFYKSPTIGFRCCAYPE